jgi:hypothetical protein
MVHKIIRWALSIHGGIHIFETAINVYESAYLSATLSMFSALIMFGGAYIDRQHHSNSEH